MSTHGCYYCGLLFDTKEELFEHVDVHSDVEKNREVMARQKKDKKKWK